MPEFATDAGVIFYEVLEPQDARDDAAEWVTLLHNFLSTGQAAWGRIAPALARRYRVLLPDLPGHGRSLGHPSAFQHEAMARQLAALIAATGAGSGHLAGCSAGGMLAQLMVQHALAQPATLTLVSSAFSVNRQTTGVNTSLDPQDFRAGRNWLEATALLHDPIQGAGYFQAVLLAGFRRLRVEDVLDLPRAALRQWRLPVCLIHGEEDEIFPVQIAYDMATELPDVELHSIPGQSHALIFRQARLVGKLLADFLDRHPTRTT